MRRVIVCDVLKLTNSVDFLSKPDVSSYVGRIIISIIEASFSLVVRTVTCNEWRTNVNVLFVQAPHCVVAGRQADDPGHAVLGGRLAAGV